MHRLAALLLPAVVLLGVLSAGPAAAASPTVSPAGEQAFVAVSVATVWTSPDSPRPIDAPALARPADPGGWVASMTTAQRRDLTTSSRTQTQALDGAPVLVLERRDGWARVVVPGQPNAKDPRGYPGWIPERQLSTSPAFAGEVAALPAGTVDGTATTRLYRDPARTARVSEVSAGTTLPVLARAGGSVLLARPGEGPAWADARYVRTGPVAAPTGADLVRTARLFLGRTYLWGGRAGFGMDCSGLTGLVYALHGVTIGRDASDQQRGGRPVPADRLAAGDLLFYGAKAHHVALYAGNGTMIEAYDADTPVRVTPVRLDGDFSGARRYLPDPPA